MLSVEASMCIQMRRAFTSAGTLRRPGHLDNAGLVHVERSKAYQAGEEAYVALTQKTLEWLWYVNDTMHDCVRISVLCVHALCRNTFTAVTIRQTSCRSPGR